MFILGSGSSARKDLLKKARLNPDVIKIPKINESVKSGEHPKDYVVRMALEKAESLTVSENDYLLTADTIVVIGRKILHKTSQRSTAREYLKSLRGRRHRVYTAFCILRHNKLSFGIERTSLKMKFLTDKEIETYLNINEWRGKSGGYGIQGLGMSFFPFISGCFSNVVGLPIPLIVNKLKGLGYYKSEEDS